MNEYLLQYGCGLSAPNGWRNFDASPSLWLQRLPVLGPLFKLKGPAFPSGVEFGNIVHGLPLPDGSCKLIYCSHVLEHLSLNDCRKALKQSHRLLKGGGTFRLVLPDLETAFKKYKRSGSAFQFLRMIGLGREERPRGLSAFLRDYLGNSQHLWAWDYSALKGELGKVGFRRIRRAFFGDSMIPEFNLVEERGRWADCLGIECQK